MRYKYLLLGILFLLSIGLNSIYAEYTIDWSIPFSVYRLIYNFTVTSDTPEAYVHVVIPESIIDQYLQYWQNKGINPFNYRDLFYPRVYFVKVITPTGPGGTYSLEYHFVQNQVTCLSTYNYYCNNFTVYLTDVPAGTHHIVIYMPAFVWEDFEDNLLNAVADEVGECIDGEWCVIDRVSGYMIVESGGWDPTPHKRSKIDVSLSYGEYIVAAKYIGISVIRYSPIILEFDITGYGYFDWALLVEFKLTDGSTVAIRYGNWDPPNINICGRVNLGTGHHKRDILNDLTIACGIPANRVANINRIYVGATGRCISCYNGMFIDNLKLAPGFLYT